MNSTIDRFNKLAKQYYTKLWIESDHHLYSCIPKSEKQSHVPGDCPCHLLLQDPEAFFQGPLKEPFFKLSKHRAKDYFEALAYQNGYNMSLEVSYFGCCGYEKEYHLKTCCLQENYKKKFELKMKNGELDMEKMGCVCLKIVREADHFFKVPDFKAFRFATSEEIRTLQAEWKKLPRGVDSENRIKRFRIVERLFGHRDTLSEHPVHGWHVKNWALRLGLSRDRCRDCHVEKAVIPDIFIPLLGKKCNCEFHLEHPGNFFIKWPPHAKHCARRNFVRVLDSNDETSESLDWIKEMDCGCICDCSNVQSDTCKVCNSYTTYIKCTCDCYVSPSPNCKVCNRNEMDNNTSNEMDNNTSNEMDDNTSNEMDDNTSNEMDDAYNEFDEYTSSLSSECSSLCSSVLDFSVSSAGDDDDRFNELAELYESDLKMDGKGHLTSCLGDALILEHDLGECPCATILRDPVHYFVGPTEPSHVYNFQILDHFKNVVFGLGKYMRFVRCFEAEVHLLTCKLSTAYANDREKTLGCACYSVIREPDHFFNVKVPFRRVTPEEIDAIKRKWIVALNDKDRRDHVEMFQWVNRLLNYIPACKKHETFGWHLSDCDFSIDPKCVLGHSELCGCDENILKPHEYFLEEGKEYCVLYKFIKSIVMYRSKCKYLNWVKELEMCPNSRTNEILLHECHGCERVRKYYEEADNTPNTSLDDTVDVK